MKIKQSIWNQLTGSGLAVAALCCVNLEAAEFSRAGKLDLSSYARYWASADAEFSGTGTVDFDSNVGGGLGIGYNFTDHINLNTDFGVGSSGVTAQVGGVSVDGDLVTLTGDVSLDYNILKSRLTPLLTAGIGFAHFNGDFAGVDFSETDFSFGGGAGLRWDFSDRWFGKAVYRATWTELEGADDGTIFHGVALAIGYKF